METLKKWQTEVICTGFGFKNSEGCGCTNIIESKDITEYSVTSVNPYDVVDNHNLFYFECTTCKKPTIILSDDLPQIVKDEILKRLRDDSWHHKSRL
jgi:hypothetical protein